ncbi:hypothetical protein PILCRDRAFT_813429 [Piloderma croceum F 1598]|uniref:Uncharacterized protein n=1 Tax=Piloderma croceum (strain F 1598) TaxID=765440 RepID=A0A0C3CI90_PILCF|nr:hypothetical protein PILCRDRAFT_813429 [Piloderma croceum F 1598]
MQAPIKPCSIGSKFRAGESDAGGIVMLRPPSPYTISFKGSVLEPSSSTVYCRRMPRRLTDSDV